MKKYLCCLGMMLVMLSISARVKPAKQLAALLRANVEQQQVHPDSLYPNIRKMEQRCLRCSDPTEQAINEAVLGYLYAEAANTAQGHAYQTVSDTTNMDEWSRQDFLCVASRHYARAFSNLDILHQAKIKDWVPLLNKGKDDALFDDDMLLPLYRSARESGTDSLPTCLYLINYYKGLGNRKAALWLSLDSISDKKGLEKLRDEYQDLDLCAEVYLRLSEQAENDSLAYALAQEGLNRYPKYSQRARLENRLNQIATPILNVGTQGTLSYPGSKMENPLTLRNITRVDFSLYRIPKDFDDVRDDLGLEKALKKSGKRVQSWDKTFGLHARWETWRDTLHWTAPENGIYLLVVQPQTNEKLESVPEPFTTTYRISKFLACKTSLPDHLERYIVTDSRTGEPQQGVEVTLGRYDDQNRDSLIVVSRHQTDERGIVDLHIDRRNYVIHIQRPGDEAYPEMDENGYYWNSWQKDTTERQEMNLYTDRSIYRPGQTLHVSGLISSRCHWDEQVVSGQRVIVRLRDANYKEVARDTVTSDAMGTFACDFLIPASGKLGNYTVQTDNSSLSVRVEEYRRPTFEVVMDEVPALQLPADSITLTGQAKSYAGVPLRNARVASKVSWGLPFWRWYRHDNAMPDAVKLDTLQTDDEGRFAVRVPLKLTKEQWRWGRRLTLTCTVTNDAGESHEGKQSVCLSSTSLHMGASVEELNDKDALKPWSVHLYSATGKEVQGTIDMTLEQKGQTCYHTQKTSGEISLDEWKDIPSGAYTLQLMGVANGDTVRDNRRVVFFSQSDNRLPVDTTLWFYAPKSTFREGEPARIQVGSSLQDVSLYYLLQANREVVCDTLIHLSDSLMTIDIPYEKRYDDGLSLAVMFVRDGKCYTVNERIELEQPDKTLQHRWITFRDHLQPGKQETWTLQVTRPDGTPASANLMTAMYDASLDALRSHSWFLSHYFGTSIRNTFFTEKSNYYDHGNRGCDFSMLYKPTQEYTFSSLNPELFQTNLFYLDGGMMFAQNRVMLAAAAPMSANSIEAESASIHVRGAKKVAALETADMPTETTESEEADPVVPVRTNFEETAFFMPQLRTDKQGRVNITFTLPESLTTWHLWGLTHTKDLCSEVFDEKIVAQKDLMAQLLLPRFLRPHDEATFTATVTNITDQTQEGRGVLKLMDAQTEKVLQTWRVNVNVPAHRDSVYQFAWSVPTDHERLIVKWMVEGNTCSDGEQRLLPVLSDEEWITNTRAITGYGIGVQKTDLTGIFPDSCSHRKLTVQYTAHPEQLALQALPALAKTQCKDALSLASAYYAVRLGQKLGVNVPDSASNYLQKLSQLQHADGSISWYPCHYETGNIYITREVCYLLTRLRLMTGEAGADNIYQKAVHYLLEENHKQITDWKKHDTEPNVIYTGQLRNLYVILHSGLTLTKSEQQDVDYLLGLLKHSTDNYGLEDQALAAIVLQQAGEKKRARQCVGKFTPRLVTTRDKGTYIEWPKGSWSSIDRKLHIHVQLMEALQRVTPDSVQLIANMRRYLLQQKRTQQWDTPVNSASAIYALCNVPAEKTPVARDVLTLQNSKGKALTNFIPQEDTLGYVCDSIIYNKEDKLPATLRLQKFSKGESWGAVYADFRQPISLVLKGTEGLDLRVEFPQVATSGSRIVARYVITADRDYEFVDLSVPHPANLEPVTQLSGYRWMNGLGYYQEMRDTRTDYHFESVPRGTYVIEQEFFVERRGTYNAGIPTLKCTYAPEFQAHTPNQTITVR